MSKHALVCVGAGVGNVMFGVPPARILHNLGYVVDCFADPPEARLLGVVAGLPCLRHSYTGPHPRQKYDVILYTAARMRHAGTWNLWLKPSGLNIISLDPEKYLDIHEVGMNCEPLRELGWDGEIPLPQVVARPIVEGNHIVLLPDCKPASEWDIKRWTDAQWAELSRCIRDAGYVPVALSDDPESTAWAREGRALDLGGHTPIWEAAGIIAGARAAVGIDNGLAHIAAAVGTPLVVLWGPASWVKNRPLGPGIVARIGPTKDCSPCQFGRWKRWPAAVDCTRPVPCMGQSVREVFDALREVLEVPVPDMITLEEIVEPGNLRKTVHALSSIKGHDGSVVGNIRGTLDAADGPTSQATLYPILCCLSARVQPRRYLEIGIAKAFSTVVVTATHPPVDVTGIDLWESNLCIAEADVRGRVALGGHGGNLTLLRGSSRELVVPALGMFDLILVDGDHRPEAMAADLSNCAPLLSRGGYLVADDIFTPLDPKRTSVWKAFKAKHPDWTWLECRRDPGVGIGRRPA